MKTFLKMIVAAMVAMGLAVVLMMHDASDNVVLSVYFFGAIGVCAVLGVFDIKERKNTKHTSIKDATRNYPKAA